jgi:hypothetical protein
MSALLIIFIIYFSGYIAALVVCRIILIDEDDGWKYILGIIFMSLLSWLIFFTMLIAIIGLYLDEKEKSKSDELE